LFWLASLDRTASTSTRDGGAAAEVAAAVLELADIGLGATLPVDGGCALGLPWLKMADMMFPNMLMN
jgi:hypothetical protein